MAEKNRDDAAVAGDTAPNQTTYEEVGVAESKPIIAPAFQFYPRDFLSSTKVQRMSMTERGIYVTLLANCWLDNGLPPDIVKLAAVVQMKPKQFERIWTNVLHECFAERGGRLHNERLDAERKKQEDYRRRQTDRAKTRWQSGGNAKPMQAPQSTGNAVALPRQCQETQSQRNALQSSSSSSSAVQRPTDAGARAPIHPTNHRNHAHCGRVCLPSSLFDEFVRRRNHSGAQAEIDAWTTRVEGEWSTGAHASDEPGEPFAFWRARYDEEWPPTRVNGKRSEWDSWRPSE